MDNKFFTFLKPALDYIDTGKLFRKPVSWLYTIIAVINLLIPFYILYVIIDNKIFSYASGKDTVVLILLLIITAGISWLGFQLWWDRKEKVSTSSEESDDFVATPVIAHVLKTTGEWLGLWIGVFGFLAAVILTVFYGGDSGMGAAMGFDFVSAGVDAIIRLPIMGFLTIVVFRFFAEFVKALPTIANSAKKQLKYFEGGQQ